MNERPGSELGACQGNVCVGEVIIILGFLISASVGDFWHFLQIFSKFC